MEVFCILARAGEEFEGRPAWRTSTDGARTVAGRRHGVVPAAATSRRLADAVLTPMARRRRSAILLSSSEEDDDDVEVMSAQQSQTDRAAAAAASSARDPAERNRGAGSQRALKGEDLELLQLEAERILARGGDTSMGRRSRSGRISARQVSLSLSLSFSLSL